MQPVYPDFCMLTLSPEVSAKALIPFSLADASSSILQRTLANLNMLSPHFRSVRLAALCAILLMWLVPPAGTEAQFRDPLTGKTASARNDFKPSREPLLKVVLTEDKEVFALSVRLALPSEGYTYSTNPDFSGATRFKLVQTSGLEPIDEQFTADHNPTTEFQPAFNQNVEKFKESVIWTRRFKLIAGANRDDVRILAQVKFQICDSQSCTPHDESFFVGLDTPPEVFISDRTKLDAFKARLTTATTLSSSTVESPRPDNPGAELLYRPLQTVVVPKRGKVADPIELRFRLAPENAKPGEPVLLSITMKLDPEWHTFAMDQNPDNVGQPTLFEVAQVFGMKATEEKFAPNLAPEIRQATGGKEQRLHHKEITWTLPFVVEQSQFGVSGSIIYQICREGQCRAPKPVEFELGHIAQAKPSIAHGPESPSPSGPSTSSSEDDGSPNINGEPIVPRAEEQPGGLGLFLIYAFLGGLILNVMPCVLPVIAIKVLSFVQQSGESRGRILMLNSMYSLGVVLVFLLLASLAVFAKLGWGNLFQKTEFQVAMSCVVFAMGLSLMGVFEIPVPGLVGSAASQQHQEGPLGAFLTGIFATLLATPCSGPFLGVTLGWSVQQESHITYLVWFVMGLGMASPYVLLGFFPGWVKYLPKPGNWMVTFKEVCGFILMGTVIFLMSSLKANWILPLLILLLSIGFSLWMIGQLYTINSPARRRWSVRSFATVISLAGLWLAVGLADDRPGTHELPWKPFAGKAIKSELKQGRTVLVDFTADWCLSCKTNEKLALNTAETLNRIQQLNIVTMKADWTDGAQEITDWLEALDSVSVPLTVIFPANDPAHPIVIRDLFTKSELLRKLDEAVDPKITSTTKLTQQPAAVTKSAGL